MGLGGGGWGGGGFGLPERGAEEPAQAPELAEASPAATSVQDGDFFFFFFVGGGGGGGGRGVRVLGLQRGTDLLFGMEGQGGSA